jgi:O-antigen/teichoic acid export membrane protein
MYGAWLATGNILTWITIVDPGVSGVLLQRVSYCIGKNNKKEIGLAITSGIVVSVSLFVVALLVGYTLSFFIIKIAKIDARDAKDIVGAFRIALWGTAFSLLADTFRNIILAYQKTKLHGTMLYTILVAGIVLNVILLIFHQGVYALAYTSFFRGLFTLGFAIFYSIVLMRNNNIKLKFNLSYFKSFSKVFAFTFSSSLFETIATNIDLILVSRYLGSQAVAVLDLSRRPVRMVSSLANNITNSMLPSLPHLFGAGDVEKIKRTVTRIWNIILWISGFIIGGFILFNYSFNSDWVGDRFWIGNVNNIIVCISVLFWTVGYNLSNITLSMGDIRNNSIVTVIRSIAYMIFLFVLSKLFGMTGVVIAFLAPVIVMISYYPRKLYKEILTKQLGAKILRESIIVFLIVLICVLASFFLTAKLNWIPLIISSFIYLVAFFIVLSILSPSFKKELNGLFSMINSKINTKRKSAIS